MIYISNAFSLQMVQPEDLPQVRIVAIERPAAYEVLVGVATSIVGHADIAAVLGVAMNRASVTLERGDYLYVAQLIGGRLPEGCKTLPEGFRLQWILVEVLK